MDKHKRQKGEKYLEIWANSRLRINQLQDEIKLLEQQYIEDVDGVLNIKKIHIEIINNKIDDIKNILNTRIEVDSVINLLEEYQKNIIKLRYINKKSWQEIALLSHISLRHCFNIKNYIIKKLLNREDCT